MVLIKFYQPIEADDSVVEKINGCLSSADGIKLEMVEVEYCYYVNTTSDEELQEDEKNVIEWLLSEPFSNQKLLVQTSYDEAASNECLILELGPRLSFSTPYSTNAVSICKSAGIESVNRLERSRRYKITFSNSIDFSVKRKITHVLHDQMTEMVYSKPIETFELDVKPSEIYEVDILSDGRKALSKVNQEMGLAMDEWDLDYYTDLFLNKIKRNPTNVECFDLAQSNSEHSRHWFFSGRLVIDGEESDSSLFKMVKSTQETTNPNNKIKFSDNSSCIEGYTVDVLIPESVGEPSKFDVQSQLRHIILTAETHNFPTGVAPFPGATTGTGGRIRDVQATGRGAHVIAGTAGYCFGNLNLPDYKLPWEDKSNKYPNNFALPVNVIVEGSNGASDYGNKYGEPVLCGFARSFGQTVDGERREWIKPIMFSGGVGSIEDRHLNKESPQVGDDVVKIGGPVYRIGVGGGAASSIQVQGDNASDLDLGAVQRGDAEMEQKMNRVVRACIEHEGDNPILSIHDQGAGGNGNVLKEICEPEGALIKASQFQLGDPTINILELWGAEYQESNAMLCKPEHRDLLSRISKREKCSVSFVGEITGNGKIQLTDFDTEAVMDKSSSNGVNGSGDDQPASKKMKKRLPVDLELSYVLGDMPKKVFNMQRKQRLLRSVTLPNDMTLRQALERVLRLPAVASKRYLTNKVDRSVTGLVAQQQCVGPLHTPLADVAVTALSYWAKQGSATAIGEQPIKMLVDNSRGARMSVGEALTNLSFAAITQLKDVKCSANWMWPAKLPGEGAFMYDACSAMSAVMKELGIAVDGGKDSLSMAARVDKDTVKAPGSLVISVYSPCTDITKTITPDLKCPNKQGVLIYINLSHGQAQCRLGGSALAQVYGQIGDESADLDDVGLFTSTFTAIQELINNELITAGHDVSDGGLITCVLEMAFAGNCGCDVTIPCHDTADKNLVMASLFHEELGYVLEIDASKISQVEGILNKHSIKFIHLGLSTLEPSINVEVVSSTPESSPVTLRDTVQNLRDIWEETSYHLEMRQCNHSCVDQERKWLASVVNSPPYKLSFDPEPVLSSKTHVLRHPGAPLVAVLREEGSNGDREMAAAFYTVGFEVHDVTMTDLINGFVTLDKFRGVVFVGGFSYADVLGSAKGWAAGVLYHENVKNQFIGFYQREDTFSLGVCNGCQLMTLLGWVGATENSAEPNVFMAHNESGRYESRFSTVRIDDSPAIMLKGMCGSTLGVWVAHGEGKMTFKDADSYTKITMDKLIPIKYVNHNNRPTVMYPANPNGSPGGAAAICSANGRHLAMMPHPERCAMIWQWPWMPADWKDKVVTSPWLMMFKNAYDWCTASQS